MYLCHSACGPLLHSHLQVGVLQQHAQLELVHLVCQALLQNREKSERMGPSAPGKRPGFDALELSASLAQRAGASGWAVTVSDVN